MPAPQTSLDDRDNFNEVVLTYSARQAGTEAARCLDCDTFCSICVGVCPNLALLTYETRPFDVSLPALKFEDDGFHVAAGKPYRVTQPFQVAVLSDFCNECGNCTTFCPTSGRPYRDKPRLYLDRAEFEEQSDNAFLVSRDENVWALDAHLQGARHRIELNGKLDYTGPSFRARLDPLTFDVESAQRTGEDDTYSLEPCAAMFVLLAGIQRSLPFLPTALPADAASAGRIAHPGYEE